MSDEPQTLEGWRERCATLEAELLDLRAAAADRTSQSLRTSGAGSTTGNTNADGGTSSSGTPAGTSATHSSALGHEESDHALEQMELRKVEDSELRSALNNGVWYNSGQYDDRYVVLYYAQQLVVVILKDLSKDITVMNSFGTGQPRWTREDEVAQYLEKGTHVTGNCLPVLERQRVQAQLKGRQAMRAAIYNLLARYPDGVDLNKLAPLMKEYSVE